MAMYGRANGGSGRGVPFCGSPNANNWNGGRGRGNLRRSKEERAKLTCEHCHITGHEKAECFKLIGYPEWYKLPKEQRQRAVSNCVVAQPKEECAKDQPVSQITSLIQQEIAKFMASQNGSEHDATQNQTPPNQSKRASRSSSLITLYTPQHSN
ncbi:hypothetical protein DH2020_022407 [Rehmannia glutinosa]|uniref:Gag-pol polyprotein n=1 Tax=Rehmannia glutinosa TaxID=99300 RepID=A0ABR0WH11_REHGL